LKKKKKKNNILPSDKAWQTSSSVDEHSSEEEDYMEHIPSDPGSPLFKSDHEFSPESDVEDAAEPVVVKRARTAKKIVEDEEDVNPIHACQVCHKTDSPEWILLCDECDHGYHCSCLTPIVFLIPSGNWYCPLCCHKKLIDSLSQKLLDVDALVHNIKAAEMRKERQKLMEISEENIIAEKALEKRRQRMEALVDRESSPETKKTGRSQSSSSEESDDSSDNEPLTYKLRKRNQTTATSYRFNDYDDLINSAIGEEMEEVKGAGNAGRGKDIATIIEAEKEDQKNSQDKEEESSGSEIVRSKKSIKRKKKNRKLNNLDDDSENQSSDESFKGKSES